MPEPNQPSHDNETDDPVHTCACGEQHRHRPGSPNHRDACTSEKKNTDSCCCGSGNGPQANQHRCGHGPKCHE